MAEIFCSLKYHPYYHAEFKYFAVQEPDWDNIPPILGFSRERKLSRFAREFRAKDDDEAIAIAGEIAEDFYNGSREYLPEEHKDLPTRPVIERLVQISMRKVKL